MSPLREITERYRLEKILRSTRAGSVLQATDTLGGGAVVIKLIALGADPVADGERFLRFAEALASLAHPSLPAVRDFGLTTDGSAFLVMEPLAGRSVAALAGTDPKRILSALAPVVDGLALLAAHGLAHGNLSPDNLLLATGPGEVKMLGLGTALLRTPGAAAAAENARFRAPEELAAAGASGDQRGGRADLARADVYSFAATLCQLLDVRPPVHLPEGLGEAEEGEEPAVAIPLALAFQLEDAEPLRRLLAAALAREPAARPDLDLAREAIQRALHGAPAPSATAEATRPAFLAEDVAPAPAGKPPEPEPAKPTVPAPAPTAARNPIPEPPKVAPIFEKPAPRLAIPEPPKPEVPPPAAALDLGEEILPSVDDDVLAAITAPPPPSEPPPPSAQTAPAAPEAAAAGWRARLLRPAPLAAAGAAAAVLAALGFVLWSRSASPPPIAVVAATPARPAAPAPPPLPPPAERLRTAGEALAAGDDHAALAALRSLTPAEQRSLPPDACRQIQALEEILSLTAPARLAGDLAAGFRTGNLDVLRAAAQDAVDQPAAVAVLPAASRETLDRARRAAELYNLAEAAARKGESAQALAQFGEIAHVLPAFRDGSGLREKAAAAIEAEAAALVKDARYEEALARLEPLRASWPDRPGLAAEVETIRGAEKNEQTLKNLLSEASIAERSRHPDEGIALLGKVKPTPHLAADYDAQMGRLTALLARVDARPPTVELRDGYLLDYDRGTVANLSFRVRDDYKVASVKVYARPGGGGSMVEMPVRHDGFVYDVEVQPSFHQNGTVDFYVVASDCSGHETYLGSREQPLHLKRRKGFRES